MQALLSNKIMLRKQHLLKRTADQLMQLVNKDTISDNILLCTTSLQERNAALLTARNDLLIQIADQRKDLRKAVFDLNDSTKDRLRRKEKLAMDRNSRPSLADMATLTQLFGYMERQCQLTTRNQKEVQIHAQTLQQRLTDSRRAASERQESGWLDEQFLQLECACEAEIVVREQLREEQERRRREYGTMSSSIDECRVEWELVEQRVRSAERELVQLTSYYQERTKQNREMIQQVQHRADQLERELLKGQELLNFNQNKRAGLEILHIQSGSTAL